MFAPIARSLNDMSWKDRNLCFRAQLAKLNPADIYSFDSAIINPDIPLKESLKKKVDAVYGKCRLLEKKASEEGDNGKVKFVQFEHDPVESRWFAIKRNFPCLSHTSQNGLINHLEIALKIGIHPNFMQVHGLVIKERHRLPKMYAILEEIEGILLRDIKELSYEQAYSIMMQVHHALRHLYETGIYPVDLLPHNMMITPDGKVKFLDFDFWQIKAKDQKLAKDLYAISLDIAEYLEVEYCSSSESWFLEEVPSIREITFSLNLSQNP